MFYICSFPIRPTKDSGMKLKWAVAAVAMAGFGFVLPAHAQELESPQMTVASESTTNGFRVAEGTDGFLLVEHGIWRMPPAGSFEPPAADASRTYLPYRYPKPQGSAPSGFRRASYLPHVYAAEAQYSLPSRSEEHTSELQSLIRLSYAVFCSKKITTTT